MGDAYDGHNRSRASTFAHGLALVSGPPVLMSSLFYKSLVPEKPPPSSFAFVMWSGMCALPETPLPSASVSADFTFADDETACEFIICCVFMSRPASPVGAARGTWFLW